MQLASVVGEFFSEADRVGPEAEAQFRFFLQEKARRCAACTSAGLFHRSSMCCAVSVHALRE